MIKLTTKNCQISNESYNLIINHFSKITRILPHIVGDLIVLRLVIKKNIDKYYPSRNRAHPGRTYADVKPELAYYEGSITFRLDKKQLYTHFKGQTIDECINTGFRSIFKDIEKYKDLHFPAESEYPSRSSIRGE